MTPCVALLALAAAAEPPKVVATSPRHHAAVGADTAAVTVTFDRDMEPSSYSWTRYGDSFPPVAGKPRWSDRRTCVLPVKLTPGGEYTVGINGPGANGFRSAAGEPARPQVLTFRVRPGPGRKALSQNRRSIQQLRDAINRKYSYRDRIGVDWARRFRDAETELLKSRTRDEFTYHTVGLLRAARDMHITVANGRLRLPTYRRAIVFNYSLPSLRRTVPDWKRENKVVATGEFPGKIGYVMIASWGNRYTEQLKVLPRVLKRFAGAKGLIVDVRPNGGGNELLARAFAGRFVAGPVVYAKHRFRAADGKGFTSVMTRTLRPVGSGPPFRGPVAVLTGPQVVSSGEAFLLMMKQVPGCVLVGGRSYGSSGNPGSVKLANGVTVNLPRWQALTPEGKPFEGKGINPDVEVETRPADFAEGDPVIAAALQHLLRGR